MPTGLTDADLRRIEQFVRLPRGKRKPDMLRPVTGDDTSPADGTDTNGSTDSDDFEDAE
jgi:hypothetical protein